MPNLIPEKELCDECELNKGHEGKHERVIVDPTNRGQEAVKRWFDASFATTKKEHPIPTERPDKENEIHDRYCEYNWNKRATYCNCSARAKNLKEKPTSQSSSDMFCSYHQCPMCQTIWRLDIHGIEKESLLKV
jgi:hypothetical protein